MATNLNLPPQPFPPDILVQELLGLDLSREKTLGKEHGHRSLPELEKWVRSLHLYLESQRSQLQVQLDAALQVVVVDLEAQIAASGGPGDHGCHARRTSTQSITQDTDTPIQFNAADQFDTDAYHDTVTNNSRITIPASRGGTYVISGGCGISVPSATMSQYAVWLKLNNTTKFAAAQWAAPVAANGINGRNLDFTVSSVYKLAVGDYIELVVRHEDSATPATTSGTSLPFLALQQLA